MPGMDAFFDPEPRLELMKEMGIDRTLLWPTLASAIEERMADDPDAAARWSTPSTSGCTSTGATSIPTPSIPPRSSLWPRCSTAPSTSWSSSHERGARIFLIRVAPVPTWQGRQVLRSARVRPVLGAGPGARPRRRNAFGGRRATQRYTNEWEGLGDREYQHRLGGPPAKSRVPGPVVGEGQPGRRHGLDHRPRARHAFPDSLHARRVSSRWIRPFYAKLQRAYERARSSSTRTRSTCSTVTSGFMPSTSPIPRGSSISGSRSITSCSARTSRTRRDGRSPGLLRRRGRAPERGPGRSSWGDPSKEAMGVGRYG